MPFGSTPRVKFQNNPLVEVICKFSFSQEESAFQEEAIFLKFHESIRDTFPLVKKGLSVSVDVNTETQSVTQREQVIYEYSNLAGTVTLYLNPSFVAIKTTEYNSKEEFFDFMFSACDALKSLGLMSLIKRIGLKYQDVIQRSSLGSSYQNTAWSELLNSSLVSIVEEERLRSNIIDIQSSFTVSLDNMDVSNAKLTATYGLVTAKQQEEQCFLIDGDFYTEGLYDYDEAKSFLHNANTKAREFFNWCIKPKLREALIPTELSN